MITVVSLYYVGKCQTDSEKNNNNIFMSYGFYSNIISGAELQEVDIEGGTTKVIKVIPKESVKSIGVNIENNSLLLDRPSVKTNFMLDADMNLIELERAPATQHILDKAFRTTNSHLIPVINMLEFGQWFASMNDSPVSTGVE